MTKKNAYKRAARSLKAARGGSYQHHLRTVGGADGGRMERGLDPSGSWWLRPGEVAFALEVNGKRTDLVFESDDAHIWDFRLGSVWIAWDHGNHVLINATDPTAVSEELRSILSRLGWPRESWRLTDREQAVLDEAVRSLRVETTISGRKLRQLLRPRMDLDESALADVVGHLCPRYLEEQHDNRGPRYTPTFGGLLRSSEAASVQTIVEAVVALLRRKYEADADFQNYTLDELMSEERSLATYDRRFVDNVISRSWLFLGAHGSESDGHITRTYGVPRDIDAISECRGFADFLQVTRRAKSTDRASPTAPYRLGGFIPERVRARLVGEPAVPPLQGGMPETPRPQETSAVETTPNTALEHYDVALSFAGEDRAHAEALAHYLKANGVRVFYDGYEKNTLWGKDLYVHLHRVYSQSATFCILFVSKHYAEKLWTNHERVAAQERAFKERGGEYILPIRIDGTDVPGLPVTVGYLDVKEGVETIGQAVLAKLRARQPSPAAPGTPSQNPLLAAYHAAGRIAAPKARR